MRLIRFIALVSMLTPLPAAAIQLDDPINFQLVQTWPGTMFGVPGRLGAMMFTPDGQTMLIVGNAESSISAIYELPVVRDPQTSRVIGFGMATLLYSGNPMTPGIDAGMERGPDDTLFYTYWSSHFLGERAVATSTTEVAFSMAPTGVPSSVAGLTFSPHLVDPMSGFAQLQVSSWQGDGIYNVSLSPEGGGIYAPGTSELFVRLPQQGTGAIQYVPQGLHTGNLMYVNWDFGEVRMLVIDPATGLPIDDPTGTPMLGTTTPRDIRFAYDLGVGPWGLEFDPLTLDFFVSTWSGNPADSIIQFSGPGFANQPPVAFDQQLTTAHNTPAPVTLMGADPDNDPLTFRVLAQPANGTVTGTTANVVYTPNAGFMGTDIFPFVANDGRLDSNTATITVTVLPPVVIDAGIEDLGLADALADAALVADAGEQTFPDAAIVMPVVDSGLGDNLKTIDDECSCSSTRAGDRSELLLLLLFAAFIARGRRLRCCGRRDRG